MLVVVDVVRRARQNESRVMAAFVAWREMLAHDASHFMGFLVLHIMGDGVNPGAWNGFAGLVFSRHNFLGFEV